MCVHIAAEADGRWHPLQRSDKGLHLVGTPHSGCCSTSWRTRSGRAPLPSSKFCCGCMSQLLRLLDLLLCANVNSRIFAVPYMKVAQYYNCIIAQLRAGAKRCRGRCSGA